MNIGVLGTGMVGRTISTKLVQLGHGVMIGTRDVDKTLAHAEPDYMGNPPFKVWHQQHPQVKLMVKRKQMYRKVSENTYRAN